ncbi:hypothetical protein [Compostimonas suwonensis]|uniref:Uncharacterized protein n=1 Tax=Compostimonas suwonensis TaxID=1048394 RepID=A0A2M9BZM4_9MICO|nr:hypothetical protein [Compostimonas suwonensis]PJJ63522.1 hypothetical protein CLV54_1190 [Compostimonas suwonensis]
MSAPQPPRDATLTQLASAVDSGTITESDDVVALIRCADELAKRSQTRLHELVAAARGRGVSWQSIGEGLGVSRQATFKRFNGHMPEGNETRSAIDLIERATDVFRSLEAGDFEAIRVRMTYTCSRVLTKRKLLTVWEEVTTASGRLQACVDSTVQTPDGRSTLEKAANRHLLGGAVVQTTLQHDAGEWIGRVAFNGSGRITGILIAPIASQNLPF